MLWRGADTNTDTEETVAVIVTLLAQLDTSHRAATAADGPHAPARGSLAAGHAEEQ